MHIVEGEISATRTRAWCVWSTFESIENQVPSLTAILETMLAVPLYWWIALRVGVIYPLLISVAIAPLVLLRSEESVALGVRWFLRFEERSQLAISEKESLGVFWTTTVISALISIALTGAIARPLFGVLENYGIGFAVGMIVITSLVSIILIFGFFSTIAVTIVRTNCIFIIVDAISSKFPLSTGNFTGCY